MKERAVAYSEMEASEGWRVFFAQDIEGMVKDRTSKLQHPSTSWEETIALRAEISALKSVLLKPAEAKEAFQKETHKQ